MPLGLSQNQTAPETTANRLLLGRLTLTLTGDITLDDIQAGNRFLDFTGTPGAAVTVTVPDSPKDWIVRNTSGQTVTVKTAAGTGVAVADGDNAHVYSDGVEVYSLALAGTPEAPAVVQAYKDVADLLAFDSHWRLDETSGTTAADAAAVADGTITGGVTLGVVDSPIHQSGNKAMTFDGTTGWIDLGAAATLNPGTSDFSLAMWLKSSAPIAAGRPFQKRGGGGSGSTGGWQVSLDLDGDFSNCFIDDVSGNSIGFDNVATSIFDGSWHCLVLVFINATGVWNAYLDGVFLKAASATSGTIAGKAITSARHATIGAAWDAAGTQFQFYAGDMAEVKYKNAALMATQIRALNQAGISFTAATSISNSPALYLRLNETSGTVATDYSFNGTDGTYTGGVTLGVADSPITNEAPVFSASFDGVDDVVTTPYAGVLGTNMFNVRGWVKTSAAGIQILASWGTAAAGQQVEVSINAAGLLVADFSGASVTGTAVINDGVWHQFAVDAPATPTVADVVLYVDGVADTISATVNGTQALNLVAGANVAIGRDIAGTGFGQFLMAEFAIDPV